MTELNLWQKCYVMSQAIKSHGTHKPKKDKWADWPKLLEEVACLLEQAAVELSPRGRAEKAGLS